MTIPARKRASPWLGVSLCTALLGLALLGCKKGEGADCYLNKDCKDTLVCMQQPDYSSKCMEHAKAKALCETGAKCKESGSCDVSSAEGKSLSVCVATKSEHCTSSSACATEKRCTLVPTTGNCE